MDTPVDLVDFVTRDCERKLVIPWSCWMLDSLVLPCPPLSPHLQAGQAVGVSAECSSRHTQAFGDGLENVPP